jgi:hypothetical protein
VRSNTVDPFNYGPCLFQDLYNLKSAGTRALDEWPAVANLSRQINDSTHASFSAASRVNLPFADDRKLSGLCAVTEPLGIPALFKAAQICALRCYDGCKTEQLARDCLHAQEISAPLFLPAVKSIQRSIASNENLFLAVKRTRRLDVRAGYLRCRGVANLPFRLHNYNQWTVGDNQRRQREDVCKFRRVDRWFAGRRHGHN